MAAMVIKPKGGRETLQPINSMAFSKDQKDLGKRGIRVKLAFFCLGSYRKRLYIYIVVGMTKSRFCQYLGLE